MIDQHILPAFATPIINMHWPDLAQQQKTLEQIVLELEQTEAGLVRSNVGGWHSPLDFLARKDKPLQLLNQRIIELVTQLNKHTFKATYQPQSAHFQLESWANILRFGQYNVMHNHPNSSWSGVYFVNGNAAVSGHEFSGKLELCDPRPGASLNYSNKTHLYGRFLLNPVAGQVVLFPSWLMHQVHPFFGDGHRISIAFNVLEI